MEDKCITNPQRDCIGLAEAAILKKRIEILEEWKEKSDEFHEDFYQYQKDQIERDTRNEERLKSLDSNVAKIIKWQEEQQQKPAKRWEGIVDKIILMFIGGVVAYVLTQLGIPAQIN